MSNINNLKFSYKKTFLLGFGAQKAGTTWLCKNLVQSPYFWDGDLKEWRIWKYYFKITAKHKAIKRYKELAIEGKNGKKSSQFRKRFELLSSAQALDNLIKKAFVEKKVDVLSDFTPANGFIPKQNIEGVINIFNNYEITTKAILILRDPVERIVSSAKMMSNGKYSKFIKTQRDFNDLLIDKKWLSRAIKSTDYKYALLTLKKYFDKNNVKVIFFEELFSQKMIGEICEFLNISKIEMKAEIINKGKENFKAQNLIKKEIYNNLKETYQSVENFYPREIKLFWGEKINAYENY